MANVKLPGGVVGKARPTKNDTPETQVALVFVSTVNVEPVQFGRRSPSEAAEEERRHPNVGCQAEPKTVVVV
ncbi:hypothetical protein TIFTF001_001606 [Ficus carica]|uniref:Uncharacterized protein n=1 Tax=Ficus carica TaxID=3494 RepID=A0AA87Z0X4_FICCA|nr:hypothetical protein TIFTF001_001606 [Ficus carica]